MASIGSEDSGYTLEIEKLVVEDLDLPGKLTFRIFRNRTVSNVFCMSGIFSSNPAFRLCMLASINWYLLGFEDQLASYDTEEIGTCIRYHFLKVFHSPIHFGS